MQQLSDDDINRMLSKAKQHQPLPQSDESAFENIMRKATDTSSAPQNIKFLQLRNAGIAMLLVIAVNVIIMSTANNKDEQQQQTATPYLQPYNLNLYQ
jgi:uncharacterized membrane protein